MSDRADGDSHEVVARLEAGESPSDLAKSTGLGAIALVVTIARAGLGHDDRSEGPGLAQGAPAHPRLARAITDESLAALFPEAARPTRLALAAGLLQILDSWDASHAAAQEADDLRERATAAYWHLIAHRREPDPGNAQYWARRVGRHPIHQALAENARPLLSEHDDQAMTDRLIPGGVWSPTAMIDLATRAQPGTPVETLARRLQRLEMMSLLEANFSGLKA